MKTDGERANWQGQRFSESCEDLVKSLNYQEKKTRTSGKDMIAIPQEDSAGLLRPYFSPSGTTLFEFTSKGDAGDQEIESFSKKIKGDISGCVLVRNIKIKEKSLEFGKNKNVFCWDIRTVDFLSSKIMLFGVWSKHGRVIEKKVSEDITYLRCLEESRSKPFQIRLAILFQDPLKEIGSEEIKKALDTVEQDITTSGILPCLIKCIVLSRSLPRRDLYSQLDFILRKRSQDETITFTSSKKPIIDFYTSPFFFGLALYESPDILL